MKNTEGLDILRDGIIEVLKKLRKESGLSQKKLSRITGIDQSVISRFEKGQGNVYSLAIICAIADAFNLDVQIEFVSRDD